MSQRIVRVIICLHNLGAPLSSSRTPEDVQSFSAPGQALAPSFAFFLPVFVAFLLPSSIGATLKKMLAHVSEEKPKQHENECMQKFSLNKILQCDSILQRNVNIQQIKLWIVINQHVLHFFFNWPSSASRWNVQSVLLLC